MWVPNALHDGSLGRLTQRRRIKPFSQDPRKLQGTRCICYLLLLLMPSAVFGGQNSVSGLECRLPKSLNAPAAAISH